MSRQVRIQHTRNYAQSRLFLLYNSHVIPDKIAHEFPDLCQETHVSLGQLEARNTET